MQTDAVPAADPRAARLHRMEVSIEEINARIARLAIALNVSLDSEHDLTRAMQQFQGQAELHDIQGTADYRLASQKMELRGLLVLRYGVEKRFVDEVGVTATRQLLVGAEEHLSRLGFQPGADGVDLRRLFDEC